MRNIFITFILYYISFSLNAQVGIGITTPDASSILELESTNQGFLPPRVSLTSTTDVTTIPSPETGLMLYNLAKIYDVQPGLIIFNGTSWNKIITNSPTTTY